MDFDPFFEPPWRGVDDPPPNHKNPLIIFHLTIIRWKAIIRRNAITGFWKFTIFWTFTSFWTKSFGITSSWKLNTLGWNTIHTELFQHLSELFKKTSLICPLATKDDTFVFRERLKLILFGYPERIRNDKTATYLQK